MPTVKTMKCHGPGWTTVLGPDHDYMLWAPQGEAGLRQYWQACWDRDRGRRGECRRGASAEEVLACFPADTEGRQARELLLAASQDVVSVQPPAAPPAPETIEQLAHVAKWVRRQVQLHEERASDLDSREDVVVPAGVDLAAHRALRALGIADA